jgi:hypothetical protein
MNMVVKNGNTIWKDTMELNIEVIEYNGLSGRRMGSIKMNIKNQKLVEVY